MAAVRCRLRAKTVWLTASLASLLTFHKSTKRLRVLSLIRHCWKPRPPNSGALVGVHNSSTGRKSHAKSDHDRWAFPIVFLRQHESCRSAREVAVVFQDFIGTLHLGRNSSK